MAADLEQKSKAAIVRHAFESTLRPLGFRRCGRKVTWTRQTDELVHVISILHRRLQYDIQWGILVPEAVHVLSGNPADPCDVGQSVMSGTPGNIRHPARGQSWVLVNADEEAIGKIVDWVCDDLRVVAERLKAFQTRRDVWTYLLENYDAVDRRDFLIPANLPLKLLTAAILAVLDRDKTACELLPRVRAELAPFQDPFSRSRLERLERTSRGLCG